MVKGYITRRTTLGGILGAAVAPHAAAAEQATNPGVDFIPLQNIFIDVHLEHAESAVVRGEIFKLVDSAGGTAQVRRRTAGGSEILYDEVTTAALASSDLGKGASLVGAVDGATLQQAIAVAANPVALTASTDALAVGSTVRTADGFIYKVAPTSATDAHLTTAGGAKLYVLPIDGCLHAEAFGVVTGNWVTDGPADKVDSTIPMQRALDALQSWGTLVLPSGTIYTGNLTIPYGKLALCIVGQGTFTPATTIQFLPGATEGFRLGQAGYEFSSIGFRGIGDVPGAALFTSIRPDNRVDMDWSFHNCHFVNSSHIGKMTGRGLTLESCHVGLCFDDLFVLDYPNPADVIVDPPMYVGTLEGGFRGFTVRNCRLHSTHHHIFRVSGNNAQNARGFTITGNQCDGYLRVIKGYANDVVFTGNNWYVGWDSADACMFDLLGGKGITITGNNISNSTQGRQVGDHPLVRSTGSIDGLTITGNTFVRRDVLIFDANLPSGGWTVRDVVIANNAYVDCFVTAPCLVRIKNAGGLASNITIDETIYETPANWLAFDGDTLVRNASVKVRSRHSSIRVHNLSNNYTRSNEVKTGAYIGTGAAFDVFVGYQPRGVRIYKNDGTLAAAKINNTITDQPSTIIFTATGFTVSGDAGVNTSGSVYAWEAF